VTIPALDRTPVATRTNRSALALIGLLLLAAGVAGLVVSFGGLGAEARGESVLDPATRSFAATHDWFWIAVAAAALLVAILALLWLRAQLSTNRVRTMNLESDRSRGTTRLEVAALERACADELQSRRGIGRARAIMLGSGYAPRLVLFISLDGREDLGAVDRAVQSDILPKIRQALESPDLPVRIEYAMARQTGRPPQ
jgi:hypothetical protein